MLVACLGRLGGLKTALRVEVSRSCEVDVAAVQVLSISEKPAACGAATIADIMIHVQQQLGWDSAADVSRIATALMDQVERNRLLSDADAATTLLSCVAAAEIRDHALLPSRTHHCFWVSILLIIMAGATAFSPLTPAPITSSLRSFHSSRGPDLRMQAQSPVVDAPRFQDVTSALAGVVTRAERQALVLTSKAARLATPPRDHEPPMDYEPARLRAGAVPLRHPSSTDIPLGQGVFLRESCRGDSGVALNPRVQAAVERVHSGLVQAALMPVAQRVDLVFDEREIGEIRQAAEASYVEGQRSMTKLGQLLAQRVMKGDFECISNVIAGMPVGEAEEFRLSQQVSHEQLRKEESSGSLEFAQKQLQGLHVEDGNEWKGARVIDHEVEFDALRANAQGVAKVIAHARPSSHLWRLICENVLFFVDPMSKTSADGDTHDPPVLEGIFKVKILVETKEQAADLAKQMRHLKFTEDELRQMGVSGEALEARCLSGSGSMAHVEWQGSRITIQVITLDEHYVQSELSSRAARARQEAARETLHQDLEANVALYRFARDSLHFLLASSSLRHAPSCDRVSLKLSKGDEL